jgi:hypothetical protein
LVFCHARRDKAPVKHPTRNTTKVKMCIFRIYGRPVPSGPHLLDALRPVRLLYCWATLSIA